MCSENKKRPEILMKLLEIAWANFHHRSTYEWKMSLAIWTAIAAFIALYLRGVILKIPNDAQSPLPCDAQSALSWAAWLVVLVQAGFLVCLKFANRVDQVKALFYESLLNDISEASKDPKFGDIAEARKYIAWTHGFWGILCQVAITIILLCCAKSIVS